MATKLVAAERDREASSWTYCSGYEGAYLYLRSDICFVVGETLNIQWKAETEFLAEPYKVLTRTRPTTDSWSPWSVSSKGLT